ncbi:thermonuclease family protein [Suttonella ornithocola]|uniref:Thermonuclease n=1 Tax=Suttonella ornithocola TaxID=279832 RepID=A0A380MSJ3_9GAMM|nr:thermonuclease family protein [Suttonella ornithocola]SUO95272.1 Thermonuclease precursor [Suttonella ornithocola]
MKRTLLLLLLLSNLASAYQITGKVIRIIDGDTVTLLSNNEQYKIRLNGIDAPERKQPFGGKSTQMLAKLIKSKQIKAVCEKKDRYKRHLCTLYLGKLDINAEMVRLGGAWVYRKYYKGSAYYALEKEAKEAKRGLWHTSEYQAIPPWEWRKLKGKSRENVHQL